MTAMRILVLVLGLAAVAFAAKYAIQGTTSRDDPVATEPARQLDAVRKQAGDLEVRSSARRTRPT